MHFTYFPGWPGPVNPKGPGVGGVAYPAYPTLPALSQTQGPGQQAMPEGSPLAGLAAHGVPVGYTPSGQPMVRAGMANQGFQLPPTLPGMPQMPGPPRGLFDGGEGAGGLLQPTAPVMPLDSANLVQQLKAQRYQK